MAHKGQVGTSLGGRIALSKARERRRAKRRRAEEKEWRSKNGPVIVTRIEDQDKGS